MVAGLYTNLMVLVPSKARVSSQLALVLIQQLHLLPSMMSVIHPCPSKGVAGIIFQRVVCLEVTLSPQGGTSLVVSTLMRSRLLWRTVQPGIQLLHNQLVLHLQYQQQHHLLLLHLHHLQWSATTVWRPKNTSAASVAKSGAHNSTWALLMRIRGSTAARVLTLQSLGS